MVEKILLTLSNHFRKSPYFKSTQRYGGSAFSIYNHMLMPVAYEDPVTDC